MPTPSVPDGLDLRKDGTVWLHIDGELWKLRRPKLGEFRAMRESLHDRDDEALRLTTVGVAGFESLPPDASDEDKAARVLAIKVRQRQLDTAVRSLNVAWMAETLTTLADHPVPGSDDWPSGMDEADAIAQLVQHWRSVPLRSGGS